MVLHDCNVLFLLFYRCPTNMFQCVMFSYSHTSKWKYCRQTYKGKYWLYLRPWNKVIRYCKMLILAQNGNKMNLIFKQTILKVTMLSLLNWIYYLSKLFLKFWHYSCWYICCLLKLILSYCTSSPDYEVAKSYSYRSPW